MRGRRKGGTVPEDQVFLAMSYVQLGNPEAVRHFDRFRKMINQSGSAKISEWRAYLNEAVALFKAESVRPSRHVDLAIAGWGEAIGRMILEGRTGPDRRRTVFPHQDAALAEAIRAALRTS